MGTKSITKFKVKNKLYGFYCNFDGYVDGQGRQCLDYIKILSNNEVRNHFISRLEKINFIQKSEKDYCKGNVLLGFLINSNDTAIKLYNGQDSIRNNDGTYTNTVYETLIDLNSNENNTCCDYSELKSEHTYLIDLDNDRFYINDIEIPKEKWDNKQMVEFYNITQHNKKIEELRNKPTESQMEQDIKNWFFEKYDSDVDIKGFLKEDFKKNNKFDIDKIFNEILGSKINDEDYFNQSIQDFHNYIISNPSDTFDSVKISIDAFDYKMMAQNEIPPQQILLQTMQKTYFTRLFNKYYFSSLTDIFNN